MTTFPPELNFINCEKCYHYLKQLNITDESSWLLYSQTNDNTTQHYKEVEWCYDNLIKNNDCNNIFANAQRQGPSLEKCNECEVLLDSQNIKTTADWKKWTITNHPDKKTPSRRSAADRLFKDMKECYDISINSDDCKIHKSAIRKKKEEERIRKEEELKKQREEDIRRRHIEEELKKQREEDIRRRHLEEERIAAANARRNNEDEGRRRVTERLRKERYDNDLKVKAEEAERVRKAEEDKKHREEANKAGSASFDIKIDEYYNTHPEDDGRSFFIDKNHAENFLGLMYNLFSMTAIKDEVKKTSDIGSWLHIDKVLSINSVNGIPSLAGFGKVSPKKYDAGGVVDGMWHRNQIVIKSSKRINTNTDPTSYEYLIGIKLNTLRLRYMLPNFVLTYDYFTCHNNNINLVKDYYRKYKDATTLSAIEFTKKYKGTPEDVLNDKPPICTNTTRVIGDIEYVATEVVKPGIQFGNLVHKETLRELGLWDDKDKIITFIYNIIIQVLCALQIAQDELEYTHNDLHLGNVLLESVDNISPKGGKFKIAYDIRGDTYVVDAPYIAVIIDYGRSHAKDVNYTGGEPFLEDYPVVDPSSFNKWSDMYRFVTSSLLLLDLMGLGGHPRVESVIRMWLEDYPPLSDDEYYIYTFEGYASKSHIYNEPIDVVKGLFANDINKNIPLSVRDTSILYCAKPSCIMNINNVVESLGENDILTLSKDNDINTKGRTYSEICSSIHDKLSIEPKDNELIYKQRVTPYLFLPISTIVTAITTLDNTSPEYEKQKSELQRTVLLYENSNMYTLSIKEELSRIYYEISRYEDVCKINNRTYKPKDVTILVNDMAKYDRNAQNVIASTFYNKCRFLQMADASLSKDLPSDNVIDIISTLVDKKLVDSKYASMLSTLYEMYGRFGVYIFLEQLKSSTCNIDEDIIPRIYIRNYLINEKILKAEDADSTSTSDLCNIFKSKLSHSIEAILFTSDTLRKLYKVIDITQYLRNDAYTLDIKEVYNRVKKILSCSNIDNKSHTYYELIAIANDLIKNKKVIPPAVNLGKYIKDILQNNITRKEELCNIIRSYVICNIADQKYTVDEIKNILDKNYGITSQGMYLDRLCDVARKVDTCPIIIGGKKVFIGKKDIKTYTTKFGIDTKGKSLFKVCEDIQSRL